MIDLHCHYLPGIDDGSQSMAESLDLARASVVDGITHAAMTPHIHPGRYDNIRSSVVLATNQFRAALVEADIRLQIYPAGEVRLTSEIIELLEQDELPFLGTLNGYRILLLEFPYGQMPVGTEKLTHWLLAHNIRPLIAHPERNKVVISNLERIAPFVEMGCLLQLTAGSVIGEFGKAVQDIAALMLERRWVSVIATDAHNLLHRAPVLAAARNWLCGHGGQAWADELTRVTPARILGIELAGLSS
ncbi:MAG: CpsB/CapC family capsule biosynthesis tyrosine phosphatase [Gallionella sp.]|nr:CpsB/CapC family capsule biosynthesis tyrosine phosphatase [Gallionella sp.]